MTYFHAQAAHYDPLSRSKQNKLPSNSNCNWISNSRSQPNAHTILHITIDCIVISECYSYKEADMCHVNNHSVYYNSTCFNESMSLEYNLTGLALTMKKRPPAEEYFE